MIILHYRASVSEFLEWICISLLIFLSGCTYFTMAYRTETVGVLVVFTFLYIFTRHIKLKKNQLFKFTILAITLLLNFAVNSSGMTTANMMDYALIIVSMGCIAMLASGITLDKFKERYIVIMDAIGIISLICFYIQMTNKALVVQLANSNLVNGYLISPFHTWGWTYIFARNAGPFWEPGAFQGYLLLAILFILNERNIQLYKKSLVILVTAIITTMSTTGYILLAITMCYYVVIYWNQSIKKTKDKIMMIVKVVSIMLLAIIVVSYIGSSNVVSNKFSADNQSFTIRMMDLKYGWGIISQKLFTGFGISSSSLVRALEYYGMSGNSVGLFAILQYFGVIVGMLFIVWNFYKTCKLYSNLNHVIIILIFAILHMTEALLLFPIYMSFLFWNNPREERKKSGNYYE